jgi:broad specificity phosphatase PhoE
MQTVWLFRHAQSEFNTRQDEYVGGRSNESPLSELGETQARRLGHWMVHRGLDPDIVYTSPAVRTRETGRLSLEAGGITVPVITDGRLQEMSQGPAEGMLRHSIYTKEVVEKIQTELLDFKLPGGESMNDVADRMQNWLEDINFRPGHETVAVYTHGFAIRCLVGRLLEWDHSGIRDNNVDNASATRLSFAYTGAAPEIDFNIDTQTGPVQPLR